MPPEGLPALQEAFTPSHLQVGKEKEGLGFQVDQYFSQLERMFDRLCIWWVQVNAYAVSVLDTRLHLLPGKISRVSEAFGGENICQTGQDIGTLFGGGFLPHKESRQAFAWQHGAQSWCPVFS